MKINGDTKLAGLLGHPVGHSFSPYIHNYLASKYDINMQYMCFDVETENVKNALDGIRALGIIGANVTIPHKVEVIPHLDKIDEYAKIIGAVNCINNEDGKLVGYNTDGIGFVKSVNEAGYNFEGKKVVVMGAGGASRSICVALAGSKVRELVILNNTISKAEKIGEDIKEYFKEVNVKVDRLDIKEEDLKDVDFLINTTPLGMKNDLSPIDTNIIPPSNLVVCDIVYNPKVTPLLAWANKNNLGVVYGIGMLIYQALQGFNIWTGEKDALSKQTADEVTEILKEQGVI